MSLVNEEIKHPTIDGAEILVLEKTKGEMKPPNTIISFNIDFCSIETPDELISLGEWLIENGKRIKKEYTSTGKKKTIKIKEA